MHAADLLWLLAVSVPPCVGQHAPASAHISWRRPPVCRLSSEDGYASTRLESACLTLRGGAGGKYSHIWAAMTKDTDAESSIPPPPPHIPNSPGSMSPLPAVSMPVFDSPTVGGVSAAADVSASERKSYTPAPLKDRSEAKTSQVTPSKNRSALKRPSSPPTRAQSKDTTAAPQASGTADSPTQAGAGRANVNSGRRSFQTPKQREGTIPVPTLSPPPLPGLTPPPTLDDSGRGNRYLNGLQSSATATRSVLQSPKSPTAFDTPIKASSAPGTYLRSEALSYLPEDASLVAFREAEASLNRSLAGQEPLTPGHFHDLLSALVHVAHQGKASFEDAQRVMEHMRARGMAVDVPALRAALDVLATDVSRGSAPVTAGEELVRSVSEWGEGVKLGLPVFRALLRVVAAGAARATASPSDALRVVALMRQVGWECDVATFNLCLDVVARCARSGRGEVADGLKVLGMIKAAGLTADVNTFRSLMDIVAWCARRSRASMADAERILVEMTRAGRHPTVGTFNGLMAVLAGMASRNKASVEEGYRILERLRKHALKPTAVTFSALMAVVAGAARQGKATIRDGEMVLENMMQCSVEADVVTYNALLAVCVGVAQHGKAALPEALAVLHRMKCAAIAPDAITFNTLLEVVAAAAHFGRATARDAERVLDLMLDCGFPFEITSFRALVRVWDGERACALARSGRLGGGGGLAAAGGVTRVPASGDRSAATARYGALLSVIATAAWARAATLEDVFTLFDRMRTEGLQPTCAMYNLGIEAAIGAASNGACELHDGMRVLDDMRSNHLDAKTGGSAPNQHTYMLLVNFIAVVAKENPRMQPAAAKEILSLVTQMQNGGLPPALPLLHLALDVFVSLALLNPCSLSTHLVQGLLQELLEPQVRPTAQTLSKAAHLATLLARQQVSDLVWTLYTQPSRPDLEWEEETHLEVLCAVCAAPQAGHEHRQRIRAMLRLFEPRAEVLGSAMWTQAPSPKTHAAEPELIRTAITAAMSAASGAAPATVLLLREYLAENGHDMDQDMADMVAHAEAQVRRQRVLGAMFRPLSTVRKAVLKAVRFPLPVQQRLHSCGLATAKQAAVLVRACACASICNLVRAPSCARLSCCASHARSCGLELSVPDD